MPPNVIHATVLVCEKLLIDKADDVPSAIRIIDAIYIGGNDAPPRENIKLRIAVWVTIKLATDTAPAPHDVNIELQSPSGKKIAGMGPASFDPEGPRTRGAPIGLTVVLGELIFAPLELGVYQVCAYLDGDLVATNPLVVDGPPASMSQTRTAVESQAKD